MGYWNALMRGGNICDNIAKIIEDVTGAGADASGGLRTLAQQWAKQNDHILDVRGQEVQKVIDSKSTDFTKLLKTEKVNG